MSHGIQPITKQTLAPALAKFEVPELYFVRFANIYDPKGKTSVGVVVLTGRTVYICTEKGSVERSIILSKVSGLKVCTYQRRTLLRSVITERQVLVTFTDEHDVLMSFYPEPRNGPQYQDLSDFEKMCPKLCAALTSQEITVQDLSSTQDNKEGLFMSATLVPDPKYIDSKIRLKQQHAMMLNWKAYPELHETNTKLRQEMAVEEERSKQLLAEVSEVVNATSHTAIRGLVEKISASQNELTAKKVQKAKLEHDIAAANTKVVKLMQEYQNEVENKQLMLNEVFEQEGAERYKKHVSELELRRNAHRKNKDKLLNRINDANQKMEGGLTFAPAVSADANQAATVAYNNYKQLLEKLQKLREDRVVEEKFRDSFERDVGAASRAALLMRSQLEEAKNSSGTTTSGAGSPSVAPTPVVTQSQSQQPAVPAAPVQPAKGLLDDDDDLLGGGPPPPKPATSGGDIDLI